MLRIPYYYSPTLHPTPSSSSPSPSPSSSSSFSDDPGLKRCVSARPRRRSLPISSLRLDPASLPRRSLLLLRRRRRRLLLWPCDASLGHGDRRGGGGDPSGGDEGDRFLQAFLLLPGEFAVKKLINDPVDDDSKECPDEFQFIKNVMGTYGYEVRMVCITERVMNTYYSRIFMGQLAGGRNISIDARPSDAINVAKNFQAPIYVNKEIVRRDAIEIIRGRWRGDNAKTIYDVSLDSAVEGPDLLAEELDLVRKMNTAIIQERYGEAAIWRDKLNKLRTPRNEP
ncbi:Bifunctional nuclease 2 [Ananas comosus]|uniref:Bifunctional nuclease 2 n=1 Tax=Ananas comosus TaxID=4615 RepID=A0A199UUT3_ANACO|nr:Bifunctional nuclease 2 [Ananas comosus]